MIKRKTKIIYIQVTIFLVALFLLYNTYRNTSEKVDDFVVIKTETDSDTNSFTDVKYSGFDLNGNRYILNAETANFENKTSELINMKGIIANFYLKDDTVLNVISDEGLYNSINLDMEFRKNVKATYLTNTLLSEKETLSQQMLSNEIENTNQTNLLLKESRTKQLTAIQETTSTLERKATLSQKEMQTNLTTTHRNEMSQLIKEHEANTNTHLSTSDLLKQQLIRTKNELKTMKLNWQQMKTLNSTTKNKYTQESIKFEKENQENLEYAGRLEEELERVTAQYKTLELEQNNSIVLNTELKEKHQLLLNVHEEKIQTHSTVIQEYEEKNATIAFRLNEKHEHNNNVMSSMLTIEKNEEINEMKAELIQKDQELTKVQHVD